MTYAQTAAQHCGTQSDVSTFSEILILCSVLCANRKEKNLFFIYFVEQDDVLNQQG